MRRAPRNAVSDKQVCSRASREARMVNMLVECIAAKPVVYDDAQGHPCRSERPRRMATSLSAVADACPIVILDHWHAFELAYPLNDPNNCLYRLSRCRKDFDNPVASPSATKRLPRRSPQE